MNALSSAGAVGLRPGLVILQVDGKPTQEMWWFYSTLPLQGLGRMDKAVRPPGD